MHPAINGEEGSWGDFTYPDLLLVLIVCIGAADAERDRSSSGTLSKYFQGRSSVLEIKFLNWMELELKL